MFQLLSYLSTLAKHIRIITTKTLQLNKRVFIKIMRTTLEEGGWKSCKLCSVDCLIPTVKLLVFLISSRFIALVFISNPGVDPE